MPKRTEQRATHAPHFYRLVQPAGIKPSIRAEGQAEDRICVPFKDLERLAFGAPDPNAPVVRRRVELVPAGTKDQAPHAARVPLKSVLQVTLGVPLCDRAGNVTRVKPASRMCVRWEEAGGHPAVIFPSMEETAIVTPDEEFPMFRCGVQLPIEPKCKPINGWWIRHYSQRPDVRAIKFVGADLPTEPRINLVAGWADAVAAGVRIEVDGPQVMVLVVVNLDLQVVSDDDGAIWRDHDMAIPNTWQSFMVT